MDQEMSVNSPKTPRGRKTLKRILDVSTQMFYEKGYHNTSINDISEAAGVALGTFYIYFEGKHALFSFLVSRFSQTICRTLREAVQNCKNRREWANVCIRVWLELIIQRPDMFCIVWESLYIDRQLFMEHYTALAGVYIQGIGDTGKEVDYATKRNNNDLAWMLMGASSFLALNWGIIREGTSNEDIEHLVSGYMDIFSAGIFTEEGLASPPIPPESDLEKRTGP